MSLRAPLVVAALISAASAFHAAEGDAVTRLELRPSVRRLPSGVSAADLRSALSTAAAVWSYPAVACSDVEITLGADSDGRLAKEDGASLVLFRDGDWCHNERCGGVRTFPLRAAGMTSSYPSRNGVLEGDIELNAAVFEWGAGPTTRPRASLSGMLAHEIGHVLGLRDVCGDTHSGSSAGCGAPTSIMLAAARLEHPTEFDVEVLCRLHPRQAVVKGVAAVPSRPSWVSAALLTAALLAAAATFALLRR